MKANKAIYLLSFPLFLFGCNGNTEALSKEPSKVTTYTSDGKVLSSMKNTFDEKGRVVLSEEESYLMGPKVLKKTSTSYADDHAIAQKTETFDEAKGEWNTTSTVSAGYDDRWNVTSITMYKVADGVSTPEIMYLSTYDQNNLLVGEATYTYDASAYSLVETLYTAHEYSESGILSRDVVYANLGFDDELTMFQYVLYHYNADGTTEKAEEYSSEGALEGYRSFTYEGKKVEETYHRVEGEADTPRTKKTTVFDDEDRKVKEEYYTYDSLSEGFLLNNYTEYEY